MTTIKLDCCTYDWESNTDRRLAGSPDRQLQPTDIMKVSLVTRTKLNNFYQTSINTGHYGAP